MSQISIIISAETVAWYGAIIATISLILTGFKLWLDRKNLKITVYKNKVIFGENDQGRIVNLEPGKLFWHLSIANVGKPNIIVTQIGVDYKNKNCGAVIRKDYNGSIETFTLHSQEARTFLIDEELIPINKIKNVVVKDATDRVWKKHI